MILADYSYKGATHFAFLVGEALYDCVAVHRTLPVSSDIFLENVNMYLPMMEQMHEQLQSDINLGKIKGTHVADCARVKVIVWPDRTVNSDNKT